MKLATITTFLVVAGFGCSCVTVLPESDPEHQIISTVIRATVQNDETKIKGPIRIEIRGNKAAAYYTVEYRTSQQWWNPMKSTLVKQESGWVVKESKSTKPWYSCYK
jgi:hypothetical protein